MPKKLKDRAKERQGPPRSPKWYERAKRNVRTGTEMRLPSGERATMQTISFSTGRGHYIAPTIREQKGKLVKLSNRKAIEAAMKQEDALGPYLSVKEADAASRSLSKSLDRYRRKRNAN